MWEIANENRGNENQFFHKNIALKQNDTHISDLIQVRNCFKKHKCGRKRDIKD
jgi:hypothetical protein